MRDNGRLEAKVEGGSPAVECVTGEGAVLQPVRDADFQAAPLHTTRLTSDPLKTTPIVVEGADGPDGARAGADRDPRLRDANVREIYRELLLRLGEDPERDGLRRTPERMEKSLHFLTRGYEQSLAEILGGALFDVDYDEMVIVRDIEFYSQCEHHMLPFYGKAHVAYIPNGKVIGLSKLPRVVDMFARRLQVQERLTRQIAEAVIEAVQPQGVGVILEAQHLCMMMRGVEKQSSMTTTSAMLGVFRKQQQTRNEFLSLVRRPGATFSA